MKNVAQAYARALSEAVTANLSRDEIDRRIDSFIDLLREKGVIHLGTSIIEQFTTIFNEKAGIVNAELTVVDSKTVDVRAVQSALEKRLNKIVELSVLEDPSVLGGMMLHLGDHLYDNTVRNRLLQLRLQLTV